LSVPKTDCIALPTGEKIPILHEDRAVIAIDKPRGWMLVPFSWQQTRRNLQAALVSSIAAGDFWARSRNLKFLRCVHRLDADTTGILLLARSQGALTTYSRLFESRRMEKVYLAVVRGSPDREEWVCRLPLVPDPRQHGKMKVDPRHGKASETRFCVLQTVPASLEPLIGATEGSPETISLVEAQPYTGRTHQIRIHLAQSGWPILGDELYGAVPDRSQPLALRAVRLAYTDPFTKRRVLIHAPAETFCREYGFTLRTSHRGRET
jgi:RluA family pseudouridine synthase